MGTHGVFRTSDSVRARDRQNSLRREPEDTGFYRRTLEEAAGGLDGWLRVNKVEGILKEMETIAKGLQVF